MEYLEVKGEKFIVMYKCPAKKYAGVSAKNYLKLYNAEASIKHKDTLYFVMWAENVNYTDITDVEDVALIPSGSIATSNVGDDEKQLKESEVI